MKKILKVLSNSKLYVLTFITSLVTISIIFMLNKVTPFGGKSLLCVDFYHQYGPMLGELYDRLHGSGGFLYSFSMGLGLPFFRNFLNYLSSPFNLLMLFFSRNNLVTSYTFIIGLKAVIASCTFVYYISKKVNNKELYLIPLGLLYAFSAYYAAYYWNIMWLDGIVFLPLITLGIEKLVKEGKWKFYTISLAIMLISNYFIGYMICCYSVLYFIIFSAHEFTYQKGQIKKSVLKLLKNIWLFTLGSLCAGMIAAIFLIPLYYAIKSISATGGTMPKTQYYLFTIEDFLKFHLTGAPTTTFASDKITAPNISTGILSIALFFLFLVNQKIPMKTKICYTALLGFFIIAFFNPQLDYILQAFHVPNDLPYRYSFIYTFVFMTICSYSIININKNPFIINLIVFLFIEALLFGLTKNEWQGMNNNMIYINMILILLHFIFYTGSKYMKELKVLFYLAISAAVMMDVIVSINYNWNITQELSNFYKDYDKTEELLNYVKNYDDGKFYRIENTEMMTLNDGSWYNYNGMTTFSSMAYEDMAKLQHYLGMPGNEINSYYYVQQTPVYDLMFDIKYFIGITNDNVRYKEIKTIDETANQFKYNVGLGYGVNDELKNWNYKDLNPLVIQNEYIEKATGVKDTFILHTPDSNYKLYDDEYGSVIKYTYENVKDNLYIYNSSSNIDFILVGDTLYYNNEEYQYYVSELNLEYSALDDYSEEKIINVHTNAKYVDVIVGYNNSTFSPFFNIYEIDQDKFKEAYNILNKNKLDITNFKEDKIEANITTDKNYVYTSIPYDEGWKVYVDDKEVETHKLANTLLTFNVEPGTHKVKFIYRPKGMKTGILLSAIGICLLFIDNIFKLIIKQIKKKHK
ncbi:MAG: YfhO family protein [Bacilli bacterium]|nr:YfhO family protein [Bacilli bacterium]